MDVSMDEGIGVGSSSASASTVTRRRHAASTSSTAWQGHGDMDAVIVKTEGGGGDATASTAAQCEHVADRDEGSENPSSSPTTSMGALSRGDMGGASVGPSSSTLRKVSPAETRDGLSFAMPSTSQAIAGSGSSSSSGSAANGKHTAAQRRLQAAHRARIMALSRQLQTRLQYAAFKVEHGWAKQSLSEVENLYYRHRRASETKGSSPSGAAVYGRQAARSSIPTTPTSSRPRNSSTAVRRVSGSSEAGQRNGQQPHRASFAEPPGGLVTPPPSGNTLPSGAKARTPGASGDIVAPPQHSLPGTFKSPSFSASLAKTGQQHARGPGVSTFSPSSGHAKATGAAGGGTSRTSYADFWSKMASNAPGNNGTAKR